MRKAFNIAAAILLVAALAWASTPWKSKPYQTWTQKDIEKIFNHSPWVSTAIVTAYWRSKDSTRVLNNPVASGPGTTSGYSPTAPPSGGPIGPSFPQASEQPLHPREIFTARWMSALTMREALTRFNALKWKVGIPVSPSNVLQRPAVYQIVVRGEDLFPFAELGEAGLAKASQLELSGPKGRLVPAGVNFYRTAQGMVAAVTFTFPERLDGKPTIPASEKKIELVCKLKKITVRFHFNPRRMTGRRGRDL
jgi:hypothetical protein